MKLAVILFGGITTLLGIIWYLSSNGGPSGSHTLITTLSPPFTRAQICDHLNEAYAVGGRDGLLDFILPETLAQYPALDVIVCMADMIEETRYTGEWK